MQSGKVTIKDIARELGISPSTVSRALKDHPDISSNTKKAVNELAEKMNYSPDPIALSLKGGKSRIIGVVVPAIIHYFFSTVIKGIENVASRAGYNVMVCNSNESIEAERKNIDALLSSRVEGILISVAKATDKADHIQKVKEAGVPLVFFDRALPGMEVDSVTVDDEEGAYQAVKHLLRTGCRRILHLSAPPHMEISRNRKNGYLRALKEFDIEPDSSCIIQCDSEEKAEKLIPSFFEKENIPDGIFATNDITAATTMRIAKRYGKKVPEDISIVGFTNGQISNLTDPALSSVEQFGQEIGKQATTLLLNRLNSEEYFSPVNKVIPTEFVKKGSTR